MTSWLNSSLQEPLDSEGLPHPPPPAGFSVYDAGKGEIALHCDVFNRFVRMRDIDKVATKLQTRDRGNRSCLGVPQQPLRAASFTWAVAATFSHNTVTHHSSLSRVSARMPAALPRLLASCA